MAGMNKHNPPDLHIPCNFLFGHTSSRKKLVDCMNRYRYIGLVYFHWFGLHRWEDESHAVGSKLWGKTPSEWGVLWNTHRNWMLVSLFLVEVQHIVYLFTHLPVWNNFFYRCFIENISNIKANNCILKQSLCSFSAEADIQALV